MDTPKITVVIPVYNTEAYLEQCLDSVLNQTLKEIEVVCVDDCSRDSSPDILKRYAQKDDRVKVFCFDKPGSAQQARKKGILEATGEYILFLDADDYLECNACEKLYEKVIREKVDILHFSSRVVNCTNLSQERIAMNQRLLKPYSRKVAGGGVFNACFREKKFMFTLWNKLFRTEVCKKAAQYMEDRYLPKAQDLYSFFVISYFADSYLGWTTEPLHNYCIGRGVVGSSAMNLDKFERYCTQRDIVAALTTFSVNQNILDKTGPVINAYAEQWRRECLLLWKNELPQEYTVQGWEILCRYWGAADIIAVAAKHNWDTAGEIAKKLKNLPKIPLQNHPVKTIGIYYYHFTIGGVQRVISLLAPMFRKMGYEVVIVTDSKPTENDFPLPEGVTRVSVCSRESVDMDTFSLRLQSWQELIDIYHFDLIFYHGWTSNVMLWDFLFFKAARIPVVAQTHSVFSYAVNTFSPFFPDIVNALPITEAISVLSEADRVFWSAYHDNVYVIPNPVSGELDAVSPVKWSNKSLIWAGRVSVEKQPEAIFTIMREVVKQVPDAKLYLAGDFDDPKWTQMAAANGIQDNVVFCGMVQDMNACYQKASILVSTSLFEGFPMTILEAQAHGIPTVMFEMPYLTLGREEKGTIGVPMMECKMAAHEIAKLLTDESRWNVYSQRARSSYEQLREYDYEGVWQQVIEGCGAGGINSGATNEMIRTIVNHYVQGLKYLQTYPNGAEYNPNALDELALKIGRIVLFIPGKIRGLIWCCRENGIKYTIKYGFEKIMHLFGR